MSHKQSTRSILVLKVLKKKKKPARKHECAKLENAESKPYQRIKGRSYKS